MHVRINEHDIEVDKVDVVIDKDRLILPVLRKNIKTGSRSHKREFITPESSK